MFVCSDLMGYTRLGTVVHIRRLSGSGTLQCVLYWNLEHTSFPPCLRMVRANILNRLAMFGAARIAVLVRKALPALYAGTHIRPLLHQDSFL